MSAVRTGWVGILAAGLLVAAGCAAGPWVRTDYAKSYDFSRLRTYRWATPAADAPRTRPGPDADKMVRGAVDRELQAKGYRKVSGDAPADFLVAYLLSVEQKVDARAVHATYGYGRAWRHAGVGVTYETGTVVETYEEGTLLLDVVDAESEEAVWRGTAQSRVDRAAVDEKVRARIQDAVARILAKFPPE